MDVRFNAVGAAERLLFKPSFEDSVADKVDKALTEARLYGELPNTAGWSDEEKFALYEQVLKDMPDSQQAQDALARGERVIVALRVDTPVHTNKGLGVYDDRMAVVWQDADGTKHLKEFAANTEPAGKYEQQLVRDKQGNPVLKDGKVQEAKVAGRHGEGEDANGDGRKDLGRLQDGKVYSYKRAFDVRTQRFGTPENVGDGVNNLLKPVRVKDEHGKPKLGNPVQRDTDHDGWFRAPDAIADRSSNDMAKSDNWTMYIHKGGNNSTDSAGCQTLLPKEFKAMFEALGDIKTTRQETLFYALQNVRDLAR